MAKYYFSGGVMMNSLTSNITMFFTSYLSNTVGYSENTIKSYRDTFVLLFSYAEEEHLIKRGKISIELFHKDTITAFLEWLESKRGVSVATRNQRLAALKSFSRYMSLSAVEYIDTFQAVLDIPPKKGSSKTVDYLTVEAITLLLKEPDFDSYSGIRDLAILSLLYESGCRVQELINLKYGDLSPASPATIMVTGKGNKTRIIPISSKAVSILNKYIAVYKIFDSTEMLFTNKQSRPLTRSGIAYILRKHSDSARVKNPQIFGTAAIHPHVLRHSKAMHLLESGVNLIYIRDFLGHSSVITTEIYAKANPEIKRKYLESAASNIDTSVNKFSEKEKETLLEWLKHNI